MKTMHVIAGAAALAALSGCQTRTDAEIEAAKMANVPPARVTGGARTCLPINQIRQSRVRNDYVIDFEAVGGDTYRMTLDNRCPGLGFERAFSYSTSISQLCSQEILTVIDTSVGTGVQPRASCGASEFVPIEYLDRQR